LPPGAAAAVMRSKLRLVGLAGAESKKPSEISGGMKKRAAIARALALEPNLLFLDEPSAGLDPVSAVELDDLILTLNRTLGLTVVLVTHELASIFKIVNQCVMLDKESRTIIARGDPRKLRDESADSRVTGFFRRISSAEPTDSADSAALPSGKATSP
jgi:phospholipid/cholesterol/gamma-HCH transport system ATP-binding protein